MYSIIVELIAYQRIANVVQISYHTILLQTIWNAQIFDGDLIGVSVVDGTSGSPIGREDGGGSGERIYIRPGVSTAQRIPLRGVTYSDFIFVNSAHALAMAAFTSDGMLSDCL